MSTPADPGPFSLIEHSPALSAFIAGIAVVLVVALSSRIPKVAPHYARAEAGITRFFKWVWSWRLSGKVKRESIAQRGYDKRDAEVKAERARSPRP